MNHATRVTTLYTPRSLCRSEDEAVWWTRKTSDLQAWRERRLEGHAFAVVTRTLGPNGLVLHDQRLLTLPEDQTVPTAVTFGSHTCCDVGGIGSASLRHALVLLAPAGPHGAPAVEVLDLRSEGGLRTGGSGIGQRLLGDDVVRFAVGRAEVTVLAARPGGRFPADWPDDLDDLAGLVRADARRPRPVPLVGEATEKMPKVRRAGAAASPTLLRPPLARPPFAHEVTRAGSVVFRERGALRRPYSRARVEERASVVVPCTEDDLERGLVLGRYSRCDGANCFAHVEKVSRVHAAVLTRRGRTWLIDTGSTNGTEVIHLGTGQVLAELDEDLRVWPLGRDEGFRIAGLEVLLEVR